MNQLNVVAVVLLCQIHDLVDAAAADGEAAPASEADVEPLQEPVQFVWQVNGRCDPHRIWVYLDGTERESGLVIDVDMFGAAKILTPDELEGR